VPIVGGAVVVLVATAVVLRVRTRPRA
jgi:hypothetical protein